MAMSKQDWVIGALWKMRHRIGRAAVTALLESRGHLPAAKARQLASHWYR